MCPVLMAMLGVNHTPRPSEKNGIVPEIREQILQRMKVHEVRRLHQLRLEKEIADLEATQETLAQLALHLERKIQHHTGAVLGLVVPALLLLRRQPWKGARAEHSGEGDTHPRRLGKAWKGEARLTKPFVLLRAISTSMGRTLRYFCVVASRVELSLSLTLTRPPSLSLTLTPKPNPDPNP